MRTDYKQSAVDRKDFRHTKHAPEIVKLKGKSKKKNLYKVVIKDHIWSFMTEQKKEDWVVGKYKTLISAEMAQKSYQNTSYYNTFEIVIEEI